MGWTNRGNRADDRGSFGSDTNLMQALGLGFAWKVLKAQWVPKHVSEDTINLRRDNKRGHTSMGKPNFINQLCISLYYNAI